jgi:hypothetical protein
MADSDPLLLNFNLEPLDPLMRELEWEAEERTLRDSKSKLWPRSLMIAPRGKGAKRPSGLPNLFPIAYGWKPPRRGRLDALEWGYADTTPLQDAILVWLWFGTGADIVRHAVARRASKWRIAPELRGLIIDTAMAHAPAPKYNQFPPAWLGRWQAREFVQRVNEILRWIGDELRMIHESLTLTKTGEKWPLCDNGSKGAENQNAPFPRLGNFGARKAAPVFHARHSVNKHREVDANGKQRNKAA